MKVCVGMGVWTKKLALLMHLEEKLANNARARVYWCGAFARLFIKLRARA